MQMDQNLSMSMFQLMEIYKQLVISMMKFIVLNQDNGFKANGQAKQIEGDNGIVVCVNSENEIWQANVGSSMAL